ncbi:bifunctional diguanylate cyclase/phosphodiesterase [Clostridium sp. AN503]|uniref:bifunctional diguanylate cyclase/phosphodiesterase n=1 Tax=Clostridium sp. AN503 TaxID=3160598 RepID=UPI003458442A
MSRFIRQKYKCLIAALLIVSLTIALGVGLRGSFIRNRHREAENILFYYSQKILLQMTGSMNEAEALAQTAYVLESGQSDTSGWFERAAAHLLDRPEVRMVSLFEGDVMANAMPRDRFGDLVGRELKDFSYIYTMAKVVKDLVVEGPIVLDSAKGDQEVFLFLQPVVEQGAYLGQVAVALDRDYVLGQLRLEDLYAQGYDYELWRVEPQNGNKEVVAASRPGVDFSGAQKTVFYLPTQWTLSIQPVNGWINTEQILGLVLLCSMTAAVLLMLAYLLCRNMSQIQKLKKAEYTDRATGLYNRKGFTAALDGWLLDGSSPVTLFYFSLEGYAQAARLIGPQEEEAFLRSIPSRLDEYIHSAFLAGSLDAGSYIIAIQEEMGEEQRDHFAKGLSLELLLKVRINGEKSFLIARYQYACCRPEDFKGEGSRAEKAVADLIHAYYIRVAEESPIRMLTEKCRQLMEGNSEVVFDEYTDLEMMELSKAFSRYRKQVEQLAYSDPAFSVGNRLKFLRDTNMLISYDKKRRFSLYCVDICSFSQYNELFSTSIGDEILKEVVRRLSRPFGSYLYRINGDVFLGISLSAESAHFFAERLLTLFEEPVDIGNLSLPLQIRIAACTYPEYGETPGELLDHIQSALRFSKESDQEVIIYNGDLDGMIRTEADILGRLKDSICQSTLEVWYQPIMHLESGMYRVAEALVRLPDGNGGYFSAGQVVSLAERNGIVESLGDYVIVQACEFMQKHADRLGITRVGINISVQQLLVGNSTEHILRLIRNSGVEPRRITLEITESVLIQSMDRAAEALENLRKAGIHIALDDFGVGYSSLNYLSNLPVDIIKIDRSLTQQILTSPKQYALLKSIVDMASINGLTVVAEGVETLEEQKAIAASGVQFIQGYYYARPMDGEALKKFLE